MHKTHMKTIIRRNGHLRLEGDETTEELAMALTYLRHDHPTCDMFGAGIPIDMLIPDIGVLAVRSTRTKNVTTVGIKSERL